MAVAAYGVWLSAVVLAKPSEGTNICGGMALLGAGAALWAVGLGVYAVVKGSENGTGPAAAALACVVLAVVILALPTLALLFPDV